MSQATIDPSLINNIISVNYIYGPAISGGPSEFQAQVNLKNIHTLEVDTLVYSNIDFGDASGNLYVGSNSGKFAINNSNTTGVGEESLYGQVSNSNVTAVGYGAMCNSEENIYVVAVGTYSGSGMFNTSDSVVIGDSAGQSLSSATGMVFVGTNAGQNTSNAECDIFIGKNAGFSNTTGCNNVFMGCDAGYHNTTGTGNLFLGYKAGSNVAYQTTNDRLIIANNANSNLITGDFANKRVGINFPAGVAPSYTLDVSGPVNIIPNTLGRVFLGDSNANYGSIRMNGYFEVHEKGTDVLSGPTTYFVIPSDPGISAWYSNGTAGFGIGTKSPAYTLDVSGTGRFTCNISVGGFINMTSQNYVIGSNAGILLNPATANNNILFGQNTGKALTTEDGNIFIGSWAGANTAGAANIFIGCNVGIDTTIADYSTMIGWGAGSANNGITRSYDTIVGYLAAGNTASSSATSANVLVGPNTAFNISGTAGRNVMVGDAAGYNIGAGSSNVFLGPNAGRSSAYTGSSNLLIIANNSNSNLIVGEFNQGQVGINMAAGVSPSYTLHVSGGPTWSWNTPRAFGRVSASGLLLSNSLNVSSAVSNSAGNYTISFSNTFPDSNYAVFLQAEYEPSNDSNAAPLANVWRPLTTSSAMTIFTQNAAAQAYADYGFSFMVYYYGNM